MIARKQINDIRAAFRGRLLGISTHGATPIRQKCTCTSPQHERYMRADDGQCATVMGQGGTSSSRNYNQVVVYEGTFGCRAQPLFGTFSAGVGSKCAHLGPDRQNAPQLPVDRSLAGPHRVIHVER